MTSPISLTSPTGPKIEQDFSPQAQTELISPYRWHGAAPRAGSPCRMSVLYKKYQRYMSVSCFLISGHYIIFL